MDWKKAKTILIYMFILLNIVLAVILYQNTRSGGITQDTIDNTQKILEQNNVHIECPIPTYIGKDYILKYDETPLKKDKIIKGLLGDNYKKTDENTYEKGTEKLVFISHSSFEYSDIGVNKKLYTQSKSGIDQFVKELSKTLEIPFSEFQQDDFYTQTNGENSLATYKGVYNNYSVYDNYINIEVGKNGLKSLSYHYKKPVSVTARDINVIPVYQILITKIINNPGIIIKDVDLGFKGLNNGDKETKTLYEGLSWRIKTSEGKEYYFNARNGEEIQ